MARIPMIPNLGAGDGVDRRDFVKACMMAAAAVGLPASVATRLAEAAQELKPSVIWLHFQECTGCTESLLRASHPDIAALILDLISLDYHETLFAAAGHQIEAALEQAIADNDGKFVLVVEGAIPTKEDGIYCKIAGRTAVDMLTETAAHAAAVIAIGSCASWGGIPSSPPNPTGAVGVPELVKDKPVITLPGCPASPYNLLGTVLQYVALGSLPALDDLGRPMFAYGRTIHEHCPRRAHFDNGRFARQFGDEGHRLGYCLYALGCKGPETHANCSTQQFGDVGAWPIGIGHPCFGCTEQKLAFKVPLHDEAQLPADAYPPIEPKHGTSRTAWAGVAGLVGGAIVGGGLMASKKASSQDTEE